MESINVTMTEINPDQGFIMMKEARRGRALVLAAHPDDEVLGCGGAIISHVGQRDPVFVVIVTDGGYPVHPDQQIPGYSLLRKRESTEASLIMGCSAPHFLDYPDNDLKSVGELAEKLLQQYIAYQPENIYLPAFSEIHPDHFALCVAGTEAARQYNGDFTLFYYETGAPLRPNCYLDITGSTEHKGRAIDCFHSQLKVQNLREQIAGLNQYRAYYLPKEVKSAEAFYLIEKQKLNETSIVPFETNPQVADPNIFQILKSGYPLISVIVRTMGRPQLPDALQSVARQIYPNLEVVLVDAKGDFDISGINVPSNFRLRFVSGQRPLPRPVAANAGLDAVSGDYFCFLDEDDLIDPDHLSELWKKLHFRDEPAAYAGIRMVNDHGRQIAVINEPFCIQRLASENFIPVHATLYRRKVADDGCRFCRLR